MAKKIEDIHGILNSNGEREITLQKICNIIDIPVPENLMDIKDVVQNSVATWIDNGKEGCFFFRITDIGNTEFTLRRWSTRVRNKKCMAVFVDKDQYENEKLHELDLPFVPVENIVEKTGKFFTYMRELNDLKTLAVTGTCGKTTTMRFLRTILPNHFNLWANEGNANSYMSTSKHIMDELSPENEIYLQEVGASSPTSVRKAASMLRPDAFILLNIFNHHINEYKTQEAILEDKASFDDYIKEDGVGIVNYDDELIAAYPFKHKIITFGVNTDREVDYRAVNVVQHGEVLELDVVYEGKSVHITTSILGVQNAYNVLAAFAMCRHLGVNEADIVKGFDAYKSRGFRQRFWYLGGYNLLIDAYNICEDSLKANLNTVKEMDVAEGNKKIAVITGENKLGENAYEISFKVGTELDLSELDHVIVMGPEKETFENINYYCHGRALYEGIKSTGYENAVYVTNPLAMEEELRKVMKEGDLILFKGMYNMDLTPVIDRIFGSNISVVNPYYIKQAKRVENSDYKALKFPVLDALNLISVKKQNKKHVVIPDEIDGVPVHSLARNLYKENKHMRTLDLGRKLKYVGQSAFAKCMRLKKVTIPSNVKVIGQGAFHKCIFLREVVIEEGVTQIEKNAFKGCLLLSKVTIPESVKYVDPTAFDQCIFMKNKL